MKVILLGTDFMYNSKDELVPIQINTAIGHNSYDRVEDNEFIFDLSELKSFIIKNNFTTIFYMGGIVPFKNKLSALCNDLGTSLSYYRIKPPALTVPNIQDDENTLIIRSAYDTRAIVDEEYCRNRAKFLNSIHHHDFRSKLAYVDYSGNLVNQIENIPDNGNHPNFILKSVYPEYDKKVYPKLFKITNETELETLFEMITPSYYLMEYHYNENKLHEGYIKQIRSLNLLFPPDLDSISIGQYTKISKDKPEGELIYGSNFELDPSLRYRYLTTDDLLNTDEVKDYKLEKIITDDEIKKMNSIISKIGKTIIDENS